MANLLIHERRQTMRQLSCLICIRPFPRVDEVSAIDETEEKQSLFANN